MSLPSKLISQPELLPTSAQMPGDFFAGDEKQGTYTAERVYCREPERYRMAVALLAEGVGLIRIGSILGFSAHTVAAIRDREGVSVAIEKERIGQICFRAAAMAFEAVAEDLADPLRRGKIPTLQKAMIGGIAAEKALLMRGEATMIIETHEIKEPDHNAFQRYIDGLASAGAGTGCGGGTGGQKGTAGAATVTDGPARPALAASEGGN